jgi:hypothetical protein
METCWVMMLSNSSSSYHGCAWDEQFERDVRAGRLDELADKALADFRAGRCTFPGQSNSGSVHQG